MIFEDKYIVFMKDGGMYQNFINIIRIYDNPEECMEWINKSNQYEAMKVTMIRRDK